MPALGLTLLLLVALLAREGTTLELPVQEKWTYWSNARLVRYENPPFPPSLSLFSSSFFFFLRLVFIETFSFFIFFSVCVFCSDLLFLKLIFHSLPPPPPPPPPPAGGFCTEHGIDVSRLLQSVFHRQKRSRDGHVGSHSIETVRAHVFSLPLFIFLDEICSSSSLSFFLPIDTFFSLLSFHCLLIIGRMAFQTQ